MEWLPASDDADQLQEHKPMMKHWHESVDKRLVFSFAVAVAEPWVIWWSVVPR